MGTLFLARVVDALGRRFMSFVGLVGMAFSLHMLALVFQLPEALEGWLSLVAILLFRIFFSISLGPLPYIITAEVFPAGFRASGVSLCWAMNWFANFIVSLTFLPLMDQLTPTWTFVMYAGVCVLAIWFIYTCVPETSCRTLEQLENEVLEHRTAAPDHVADSFLEVADT